MDRTTRSSITRRSFLAGAAALAVGPTSTAEPRRRTSPNEMLNLAVVGAGGRGADNLNGLRATGAVNVVALCDCDERRAADSFKQYPEAKRYSDWRRMFETEKGFDA